MISNRNILPFRCVSACSDIGPSFRTNGNIMIAFDIISCFVANCNVLLSVNIVASTVSDDYMGSFRP